MEPLIILGAGASHDYIPDSQDREHLHEHRPPLTSDLFNAVKYDQFLRKYPDVGRLAADKFNLYKYDSKKTG